MHPPPTVLDDLLPSHLMFPVRRLLLQTPRTNEVLAAEVEEYRQAVSKAYATGSWPDMDHDLAMDCATQCLALLERFPMPTPAESALLHVACRYFVISDDDEDDFESMVGFDDDALVVNACARALGAADLAIALTPR